jgi:GxxExxY protein
MHSRSRDIEDVARLAVDYGLKLHRDLGPGLLESVYETVLEAGLLRLGLHVERQKPVTFEYDSLVFVDAFRTDLVVEERLIIEVKSVDRLLPVHGKQLLTYLKLTHRPLGLLMNFGAATFREGLKRIVNEHSDFASSRLRVNQIPPQRPPLT